MAIRVPAPSSEYRVICGFLDSPEPDETNKILKSLGVQEREPQKRGSRFADRKEPIGCVRQIIQLSMVRGGSLLPVSILLLTSAWIAPESRVVKMLLGPSSLEKGLGQAETRGYYENILDASKLPNRDPSGVLDDDTQLPPPGWIPFCAAGLVEAEPTYLLWKLRPSLDVRWNGTSFHTNNLGYRTPEVVLEKPPHVYRILVFGSSNTMGHGVDDEALYPRLLEQWLNEQVGAKLCVEVVNLSIAGRVAVASAAATS